MGRAFLATLIFTSAMGAHADAKGGLTAFVGAGQLLSFPDAIRAGYSDWEAGKLNFFSYGVQKLIHAEKTYFSFGLCAIMIGNVSVGPSAGVGVRWELLRFLSLRGELLAVSGFSGTLHGSGVIGLQGEF